MMNRSLSALLLAAAALPAVAVAGPQYTAEEIIEHFSGAPGAGDTAAKPVTRGVFIGATGFGSEAGATAAASQGVSGAAAAAVPQTSGTESLAIPMTGANAGLASQPAGGVGPVAAAAPPSQAVEQDPGSYDLLITFDFDSATLTPQARENLDAFVAALQSRALQAHRFAVDGHTDAKGSDAYNQELSERRAVAVVDYLVGHGIDGGRLVAQGYGETSPRNADPEAPENRRVEARLLE
jgi:outer membrane protein OmpA-like peptidoglycan-associated protein